jgi:hypothetical protein
MMAGVKQGDDLMTLGIQRLGVGRFSTIAMKAGKSEIIETI